MGATGRTLMEFLVNIVRSSNTKDELFYNVIFAYCMVSALFVPVAWLIIGSTHKVLYLSLFFGMPASVCMLWNKVDTSRLFSKNRKYASIIITPIFFMSFCLLFAVSMYSTSIVLVDVIALSGAGALVIFGTLVMRR
jgi:hypothetical protein